MYIVTHKFTQHVKKNQFFFLRGIILPLSPLQLVLVSTLKKQIFYSTLSEFENFLLCERILINVTTCQNETSN
jgi:hypothetical protein